MNGKAKRVRFGLMWIGEGEHHSVTGAKCEKCKEHMIFGVGKKMEEYGDEVCPRCGGVLIWQTDEVEKLDGAIYVCDEKRVRR